MSQSSATISTTDGELVSPEETQEGKEHLPPGGPQTAATPCGEPQEPPDVKTRDVSPRKLRCL